MSSKLITPESPLLVPPKLAAEIGLEEALILQQIHYYCLSSKHVKQDGRRWFWKTLDSWSQTLPFLKPSAIRRAIANLKNKFKLIDVERHSQKSWYQANWFTINVEALEDLWNRICHLQQIDTQFLNTSICSEPTNHIKDYSTKTFSTQQQAAAEAASVLEKIEPDWDENAKKVTDSESSTLDIEIEQPKPTHFVEISNQNYATNEQDSHEDHYDAADENKNQNQIHEVTVFGGVEFKTIANPEPLSPVQYAATSDLIEGEDAIDSIRPSIITQEMRDITYQLRSIKCTPAFRVNPQVQDCIKKYWQNVPNAIAFIKEQVAANIKPKKSWEAWFVYAVVNGLKSEKGCVPTGFASWFEDARKKGLVIASEQRADGVIGVCLAEKIAAALGVEQWVRFEKAVELLSQPLEV
jgi:hypothetical protein